jgi:homoserine acetyltransferase
MHYTTFGAPVKDKRGHTTNAVLILHGTSGTGRQFLRPVFADVLFGPGQLLDTNQYYIILPDNVGHGKSSKPSDGMHAHFPQYDYADMVLLQHELVEKGLGVDHLRLVMGTSMGCMHSWMWGEAYPTEMDALMPLALFAGANCRPKPHMAENDHRRNSPGPRMEERRLYRSASRGARNERGFSGDRRQCPVTNAARTARARCRR